VSPISGADKKLSRQLQRCLRLAEVKRAELLVTDRTRNAITFHDLRATGLTWAAVRGDDPLRIKQRAGHRTFSTTEGYIREAENLRDADFGTPFPPLPELRIASGFSGAHRGAAAVADSRYDR
jgi:integrase